MSCAHSPSSFHAPGSPQTLVQLLFSPRPHSQVQGAELGVTATSLMMQWGAPVGLTIGSAGTLLSARAAWPRLTLGDIGWL